MQRGATKVGKRRHDWPRTAVRWESRPRYSEVGANCFLFNQLEGLALARTWGFESPLRTSLRSPVASFVQAHQREPAIDELILQSRRRRSSRSLPRRLVRRSAKREGESREARRRTTPHELSGWQVKIQWRAPCPPPGSLHSARASARADARLTASSMIVSPCLVLPLWTRDENAPLPILPIMILFGCFQMIQQCPRGAHRVMKNRAISGPPRKCKNCGLPTDAAWDAHPTLDAGQQQ